MQNENRGMLAGSYPPDEIIRGLNRIKGRVYGSPQKKTFPNETIGRIVIVVNDIGGSTTNEWAIRLTPTFALVCFLPLSI